MTKTRVAVLRGGPSNEYEVSMRTGSEVLTALRNLGYYTVDIPVTKQGEWLVDGRIKSPEIALQAVDVAFIAMHGAYGEDGTVQRICERLHIPFTGSNSFASAIAFNKDITKRSLHDTAIKLPQHVKVTADQHTAVAEIARAVTLAFGPEYVVKPLQSGSSVGVTMATEETLPGVLTDTLSHYGHCLVEERIIGTEATCAVLADFRETDLYVLPPVEIVPPAHASFFSSEVKYDGSTNEICPGRFSYDEREKIAQLATLVHKQLGLAQYSRTDCIVRNGEVYFLEVNTLPGLTATSLFPKAADAVGLSFGQLIDHLVRTARVYN
jgi:D-alanine-D-alanine ligase